MIGIGVLRVVLCHTQRMAFVQAYADYAHLDTNTFLGLEVAKREVPGHFDSANFSLLCAGLLLLPLIKRIGTGAPWARNLALILSAAGGLNTLGSLAVPSPWWYYVLTVVMVALTGVVIVLLWRTPVIDGLPGAARRGGPRPAARDRLTGERDWAPGLRSVTSGRGLGHGR